jgi:transposase
MGNKINISRELLKKYYTNKELNITEVSKIFGCGQSTIYCLLVKYDLIRSRKINIGESRKVLYDLYWNKNLSTVDIGKIYNCSYSVIIRVFNELNIKIRTRMEGVKLLDKRGKNHPMFGRHHSKASKKKMSISSKRENLSKETLKKMRDSHKGKKLSIITRKKMSKAKTGVIFSEERKKKISLSKIGNKNPMYGKYGKLNPNYIEGRTPIYEGIKKLFEYKNWRNLVYERDGYTCQECGKQVSGHLEAHHCNIPYAVILSNFLKEYDQFSPIEDKETLLRLATKYEPFWDVDNGQTLCEECHNLKRKDTITQIKKSGD